MSNEEMPNPMSNTSATLARRSAAPPSQQQNSGISLAQRTASGELSQITYEVLKETYFRGLTDAEAALAIQVSQATQLRIDNHELWVYKRGPNEPVTITISIDGFRAIAHSSGVFAGTEGPFWCGKDGVWRSVWLDDKPPLAARYVVHRTDVPRPFEAVIHLAEFRNNSPFWKDKPVHQSGVRVATHAFRLAFRQQIAAVQERAQVSGAALLTTETAVEAASALAPAFAAHDSETGEILDAQVVEAPQPRPIPPPAAAQRTRASVVAAPPPPANEDRRLELDDESDADDVEFLEAASVHSSNRPPVQAPLLDVVPTQPAPRAMSVEEAREAQAASGPPTLQEAKAAYRRTSAKAGRLRIPHNPPPDDALVDDWVDAEIELADTISQVELHQQANGNGGTRR